jgi:hypothetical protein
LRAAKTRERWDALRRATNGSGGRRTGGVLALPAAKARERVAKRAKRVRAWQVARATERQVGQASELS